MAIFEIINTTDSLIQNIIRIVCLCWLIFNSKNSKNFILKTLETMLNYAHQFIKIRLFFCTRLIPETKSVTRNFYFISETSKSLSVRSRSLKKIYRVENFRANVLKYSMLCKVIFMPTEHCKEVCVIQMHYYYHYNCVNINELKYDWFLFVA